MPNITPGVSLALKCLGTIEGPRFLDGRTGDGTVGLAPSTGGHFTGTRWEVIDGGHSHVILKCMGTIEGPRFLEGRIGNGTVGLVSSMDQYTTATRWEVIDDGPNRVILKCIGIVDMEGPRFLDGRTGNGTVGLAPVPEEPFTGTLWEIVNPIPVQTSEEYTSPTVRVGSTEVSMRRNTSGVDLAIHKEVIEEHREPPRDGWTTEVRTIRITAESKTFLNASQTNFVNIVPGAVYRYEDFVRGSMAEITGNRNPITIYTDHVLKPGGRGLILVNNPSASGIFHGNSGENLNLIINNIRESNGGSDLIYRMFTSNSESELNIKLTAGGSFGGFTASGSYTTNQIRNRFYITVDVLKKMFTIKAQRPDAGFFSVNNGIPNKVYIKEVDYGTRVLANVEITLTKRDDIINVTADYRGAFKANASFDFTAKNENKQETVNAYVIGGPMGQTILPKDTLEEAIKNLISSCTYQHAKPIMYKLGDMYGNTISTYSATDNIIERISVPDALVYHLVRARVTIETGNDNKERGSTFNPELYSGNGTRLMVYGNDTEHEYKSRQITEFTLNCLDENNNELLRDNIKRAGGLKLRIRFYPKQIFLGWDRWDITNITITLTFKDQNGVFDTAPIIDFRGRGVEGFLRDDYNVLECFINDDFSASYSAYKHE
ncbi:MAG: hypothetical protein QY317_01775 [Candidatus Jettenia caeni]|nr:MAG: hypothetical protein QY317_01775 [Candidatus Jettenia caeni]